MHSGKLTTATTNTYLNLMMLKFAAKECGLRWGEDIDALVEGDDNLVFLNDRNHNQPISNVLRTLGMRATCEEYDSGVVTFIG